MDLTRILAAMAGVAALLTAGGEAQAAQRVALVIGNDRYPNLPQSQQLQRAAADAANVGKALTAMGFQVIALANADRLQMNAAIDRVAASLDPGGALVVYFAGHGMEIDGGNYLVPTDAPPPSQASERLLKKQTVSLESLFEDLKPLKAKTTVVILDACRDNPYRDPNGRSMGGERGLERADPPEGFFVLYSAGQGQTALDRLPRADSDPDSVYTRVLLRHLADRVSLIELAKTVQAEVASLARAAGFSQIPAYYDQMIGSPSITGEAVQADYALPPPQSAPRPAAPPRPELAAQVEAAVQAARLAEQQARAKAAEALLIQAQAVQAAAMGREAATKAEAGESGYGVLTGTGTNAGASVTYRYAGQVANGRANGFGVKTWSNGEKDEGQLVDDLNEGLGRLYLPGGDIYEGQLRNDKFEGLGSYIYRNGDVFRGEFHNIRNGMGVYTSTSNDYRELAGQWADDKFSGYGVIAWKDGRRWEGGYAKGDLTGLGAKRDAQGRVVEQGEFAESQLKTAMAP